MADRDILFAVRNNFYIGAYNNAINEASDIEGLSEAEQTERDVYVYRSYIALGSHDVSCPVLGCGFLLLLLLSCWGKGEVTDWDAPGTASSGSQQDLAATALPCVWQLAGSLPPPQAASRGRVAHNPVC
jgi:hypothetical protein